MAKYLVHLSLSVVVESDVKGSVYGLSLLEYEELVEKAKAKIAKTTNYSCETDIEKLED